MMQIEPRSLRSQTIVDGALKILDSHEKWIQSEEATDKEGNSVNATNPEATCWCLEGALTKAAYDLGFFGEIKADYSDQEFIQRWKKLEYEIDQLFQEATYYDEHHRYNELPDIIDFNDDSETDYHDIIELLERASEVYYR